MDKLILSAKMFKFADDTKLCHRARNPDGILELQDDISKLVEWANEWQMSFNVDKCSVMHIGHNNMQCYIKSTVADHRSTAGSIGIIITKDYKWQ